MLDTDKRSVTIPFVQYFQATRDVVAFISFSAILRKAKRYNMLAQAQLPSLETSQFAERALASLKAVTLKDRQRVKLELPGNDGDDFADVIVELPAQAIELLVQVLGQLAEGNAVTIVPIHAELSTQQSADLLNVSRPFLIKLLEGGQIPYNLVGTHRRVRAADVLAYQRERAIKARAAVDELAVLGQELGT